MTTEEIENLTTIFNSGVEVTFKDNFIEGNVLYIEDCDCWFMNYTTEKEQCVNLENVSLTNFVYKVE